MIWRVEAKGAFVALRFYCCFWRMGVLEIEFQRFYFSAGLLFFDQSMPDLMLSLFIEKFGQGRRRVQKKARPDKSDNFET